METSGLLVLAFFVIIGCGGIAAGIAQEKGRSAFGWFVLGLSVNFLAILFVSIAPPNQEKLDEKGISEGTRKRCPECDEGVRSKAKKCRYCHSTLEVEVPQEKEPDISQNENSQQSDGFTTLADMKK